AARERNQPESVTFTHRCEQLNERGFGLLDLFTRHGARHVDYGDEIATQRGGVCRCPRREQEHEVSVFTDGMVRQQRQADQAACERQQQLEVSGGRSIRERPLATLDTEWYPTLVAW